MQRSRLLSARDEFVQRLAAEAKARLVTAASLNQTAYGNLLKGLIKQGVTRLAGEAAIEVRARPQDVSLITKIVPATVAEIAAAAKDAGEERVVTLSVVPWPALGASAGGIILAAKNGTIRCDNTLEERLAMSLADLTPVVRDLLFPSARAEVRIKPPVVIASHAHNGGAAPTPAAPPAAKAPAPAPVPAKAAPAPLPAFEADPFAPAAGAVSASDPFAF